MGFVRALLEVVVINSNKIETFIREASPWSLTLFFISLMGSRAVAVANEL